MIRVVNEKPERYMHFISGTGGLFKGQLCVLDSGTAIAASEGVASAILLGIAVEDALAGAIATIYPLTGTELEIDIYQGSTVDVGTAAMIGLVYDIYVDSEDYLLDLNDTGGPFLVLMSYNNEYRKAYARAINSVIYVG